MSVSHTWPLDFASSYLCGHGQVVTRVLERHGFDVVSKEALWCIGNVADSTLPWIAIQVTGINFFARSMCPISLVIQIVGRIPFEFECACAASKLCEPVALPFCFQTTSTTRDPSPRCSLFIHSPHRRCRADYRHQAVVPPDGQYFRTNNYQAISDRLSQLVTRISHPTQKNIAMSAIAGKWKSRERWDCSFVCMQRVLERARA